MERVAVLAITKNGIDIGSKLGSRFSDWQVFAPAKLSGGQDGVVWYSEPTAAKVADLFFQNDALICIFSLGAVIRLITPHIKDKKTDPAVLVIDDQAEFVISALSGHIGGANALAKKAAACLGAMPVITTAADVNKTIAVDLLGRDLGWRIEDDSAVTRVSAHMVNGAPIGAFQDAGSTDWHKTLPSNVSVYSSADALLGSDSSGYLVISDRLLENLPEDSVLYRPPSLVVGIGLHYDTTKEKIREGIAHCLGQANLSPASVSCLASIKKPQYVAGLAEAAAEMGVPVKYVEKEDLAEVKTPNPSKTVESYEGTPSVSEAAAIIVSGGSLVVEKQKFPPDLTVAVARRPN